MTIEFATRSSSSKPSSISSSVNLLSASDKISILEPLVKSIPGCNSKMRMKAARRIIKIMDHIKDYAVCVTILSSRSNNHGSSNVVSVISSIDPVLTPHQPFRYDKKPLYNHNPNHSLVANTDVINLIKIP